jgi:hypothetical protein
MLTEKKINFYRTPNDVHNLITLLIDSYFNKLGLNTGERKKSIINRLKKVEIDIPQQLMHIFEAPLDKIHFKDIIDQSIDAIVHDLICKAYNYGIISKKEADMMNVVLKKD